MNELLAGPGQIGVMVLRTLVAYAFVLVGFRLSGKSEVGQLAPFDFALVLPIASAVQNAMAGLGSSLVGGFVAAAVHLGANAPLGRLAADQKGIDELQRGKARMPACRGHVDEHALQAERISHGELLQALRENGCAGVADCRLAALEVDGPISVLTGPPAALARGPRHGSAGG